MEDIVVDGVTGSLVPDIEHGAEAVVSAAVEKIASVVADRERLRAMRAAALNHAVESLSWDRWARAVATKCETVAGEPGS
ncbi:hypothetical protein [Janibacter massiliensis]|uniref:hypothetical protein n=1 Tax=Janibacter massiliensis TaxID=2058291 RepID=UPI001F3957C6|nr:hypothetical protein [Janibacter massiliensis]